LAIGGLVNLPGERRRLAPTVLGGLLVALYLPLVFLVVSSVNSNPASTSWTGFTTEWYRAAIDDRATRDAVTTSLKLAAISSIGATLVATLAVLAVRRRRWFQRIHGVLVTGRVATPEIIVAAGIGALIPAIGGTFGFRAMALAHITYLAAFASILIGARAASTDAVLEDIALDLGARPSHVLRRVVLADLRPAIVSALLLCAAFSFDDVALSLTLRGPNDTTLPVLLLSAMQRRVTPSVHAIGSTVLVAGIAVFAVAAVANRSLLNSTRAARSASAPTIR
jgi:ABC-type spermidine/putrescine transport system permease subunit II